MLRTHTCGELGKKHDKKEVTLCGWVQNRRDHGGIIFIDLRDRFGLTQVVFDPKNNKDVHTQAEHLGREWVLKVTGRVRPRGKGLDNPNLATGQIEILVDSLEILNTSEVPPIEVDDRKVAGDESRLKYRYLDLRRPEMQHHMTIRHKGLKAAMNYLDSQNFRFVQTPMLVKPTPEGARDYSVPSRVNPGKFYACPQSPQLYKQMLMVSGIDRYFQFAVCLRDEDLRADRQPEHTQIDLEMSFCKKEDVFEIVEGLMKAIFKESIGIEVKTPFPKYSYAEAMARWGIDKPDTRFGLELSDISQFASQSNFNVFKSVVDKGGVIKSLVIPKGGEKFSRKEIEKLELTAKEHNAHGLAWFIYNGKNLESNISKFFPDELQDKMAKYLKLKKGDLILCVADTFKIACTALAHIRLKLGEKLKLIPQNSFEFSWTIDFPMFAYDEDAKKWEAEHHLFTNPKQEHLKFLETDPGKVLGELYDLVLNGVELCSGSIRINKPEIQERVMNVIGLDHKEAQNKFGFLINAFKYGAPPHGGVGLGYDRITALMCGKTDIREVIAFPKNKSAQCPMDGCPSELNDEQLKEVHIKLDLPKKK